MGPVWMYRKGEARLFASPEDIPSNAGWVDSPAIVVEVTQAPQGKPKAKRNDDRK